MKKSDHLIDKDHVGQPLYCQAERHIFKAAIWDKIHSHTYQEGLP